MHLTLFNLLRELKALEFLSQNSVILGDQARLFLPMAFTTMLPSTHIFLLLAFFLIYIIKELKIK